MKMKKVRLCFGLLAVLIMAGAFFMPLNVLAGSTLDIYAIDMGTDNYGEATYLESDGRGLLMDSGDVDPNRSVFKWLDRNNKKSFDVYLSHYHDDHDYYLAEIISKYNVGTVYLPDNHYMRKGSGSYMDFHRGLMNQTIDAANRKGVPIRWIGPGSTFTVGSTSAEVLYGCGYDVGTYDTHSINNNSLLTRFSGAGVRFLTGGDLEKESEYRILQAGIDLSADIFKMNHHGGNTSNINEFINQVNPQYAWFSYYEDGDPNRWATGWTSATVGALSTFCNVLGTRYNGNIHYSVVDGFITASADRHTQTIFEKITYPDGTSYVRALSFNNQTPIVLKEEMFESLLANEQCQRNGAAFNGQWKRTAKGIQYIAPDGSVLFDTFLQIGDSVYYVDGRGLKRTGWTQRMKDWYYLDSAGVLQTGWTKVYSDTYYLGEDGRMRKGVTEIDGSLYCLDDFGRLQRNGWKQVGGKWYYADGDGICQTGLVNLDGITYYMGNDGAMRKGVTNVDGTLYCLDDFGRLQRNGWKQIYGKWYYADENGVCLTGFADVCDSTYYLGTDGAMRKGITDVGGKLYCLDGYGRLLRNTWSYSSGKWHYADENGILQTGVADISDEYYLFNSRGEMLLNSWLTADGKRYHSNGWGYAQEGWQRIGGYWYYLDPEQHGAMSTGLTEMDNNTYLLGSDGTMKINAWLNISGKRYHSDGWGVVQNGWKKIGGYWYYLDPSQTGAASTGLVSIDGQSYLFGSDGIMKINVWQTIAGKRYHSDGWGVVQKGWQQIGGKWYYFSEEDGSGCTGLCQIGEYYYYLNSDSSMFQNGWKEVDGTEYYFNGYGIAEIINRKEDTALLAAAPAPAPTAQEAVDPDSAEPVESTEQQEEQALIAEALGAEEETVISEPAAAAAEPEAAETVEAEDVNNEEEEKTQESVTGSESEEIGPTEEPEPAPLEPPVEPETE